MKQPCASCKNSGNCEDKHTPWVRDIVARGHSRCAAYEPEKKNEKKTIH